MAPKKKKAMESPVDKLSDEQIMVLKVKIIVIKPYCSIIHSLLKETFEDFDEAGEGEIGTDDLGAMMATLGLEAVIF